MLIGWSFSSLHFTSLLFCHQNARCCWYFILFFFYIIFSDESWWRPFAVIRLWNWNFSLGCIAMRVKDKWLKKNKKKRKIKLHNADRSVLCYFFIFLFLSLFFSFAISMATSLTSIIWYIRFKLDSVVI